MNALKTADDIWNFDLFVNGEKKGIITLHVPVVDICAWHNSRPSPFEVVLGIDRDQISRIIYMQDGLDTKTGEIVPIAEEPDCLLGVYALSWLIDKAGLDNKLKNARSEERLCMAQLEFLMADAEDGMELMDFDEDDIVQKNEPEYEPEDVTVLKRLLNTRRMIDAVMFLKENTWKIKAIRVLPAQLRGILQKAGNNMPYATYDIRELYEKVIAQNGRLEKLSNLQAPDIIIRNEILHLQKAVDSLYANDWLENPCTHIDDTPYMSITSALNYGIARF